MSNFFPVQLNDKARLYDLYGDWLTIGSVRPIPNSTEIGVQYNVAGAIVPYGLRAKVKSIIIRSTFGITLQGQVQRGFFSGANPKVNQIIVGSIPNGGGTLTIDWPEDSEWLEGGFFDLRVTATEVTSTGIIYTWPIGQVISSDENVDAKYIVDVWGDSITWTNGGNKGGLTIPNFGNSHYASRICAQLRKDGINVWKNSRGFGGSTSTQLAQAVECGLFSRPQSEWKKLKMVIIGTGINDAASQTVSASNFVSNMKTILNYIYLNAPDCAVLLMGQTPTDHGPRNNNLAGYRSAMQALVTDSDYIGKQIKFVDTVSNFPVVSSNFSDTGPMLHPRWDTGGLLMYQAAYPIIQTFDFYLNK